MEYVCWVIGVVLLTPLGLAFFMGKVTRYSVPKLKDKPNLAQFTDRGKRIKDPVDFFSPTPATPTFKERILVQHHSERQFHQNNPHRTKARRRNRIAAGSRRGKYIH